MRVPAIERHHVAQEKLHMSLHSEPLTDLIGSRVYCDLPNILEPGIGADLRRLVVERGVLVFKELNATPEDQVTLARSIGSLREQEGKNGIYNITLDRKAAGTHAEYLKGTFLWHMDGTHDAVPIFASLLTARQLSSVGGQTEFANSYAAYDALPQSTKDRIDGLKVVHSVEVSMRRAGVEPTDENLRYWRSMPPRTHNLVWTHESGRKSLVIGCHASHVAGMDEAEGDRLLRELLEWTTQPQFVYRHEWSPGDMLIWDNTGVLHRVEPYPEDSGRLMQRTTLLGEEAFA
jgi:alpha-ketoglutarate-dependent taurine dioxygenase